uniref:Uncharacterized protein n=1 Tax=Arundo donax TaxID=35708 RepID=A0A0A8ZG61_ARUDO
MFQTSAHKIILCGMPLLKCVPCHLEFVCPLNHPL